RGGARVRSYMDPTVKYHAKYLVADAGPAIIATANLTHKCLTRTFDALVVTHDAAVVDGLHELMAADLAGRALPASLPSRLIVGPECARRQVESLIDAARFRIRLIDAKLSDVDIQARLELRRRAGVQVEILDSHWIGDLKSHGKVMLIDDRVAVVGSLALAPSSLDRRRELAITVDNPAAVADLGRVFDSAARLETGIVPTSPIPPQLVRAADRYATC
ncbi:MAG: phospholipase D-like domain-containing protein, partial [Acidobacteriota bacterium]